MKVPTIEQLKRVMEAKGYPFFFNGENDINTIGIRSAVNDEKGEAVPNTFNDIILVVYKIAEQWLIFDYKATTIPGKTYFENPMNAQFGTAILVPGFYQSAYVLGFHFGKPALQQVGNLKLYRDSNKDLKLDLDPLSIQVVNWSGINIHYSMDGVTKVDNWSAGCQVLAYGPNSTKYTEFILHYKKAIAKGYKNSFSYCLLLETDFV